MVSVMKMGTCGVRPASHAEEGPAQRRADQRTVPADGSQQEHEDQRRPHRAVHHLRPVGGADIARQAEDQPADQRCHARASQIAAQQIAEQRRHVVDHDVIPLQRAGRMWPCERGIRNRIQFSG